MTSWDTPGSTVGILNPNWDKLEVGSKISLVLDGCFYTNGMLVGTSLPDGRPVKVVGAVNNGVRGCHRLTMFDVVYAKGGARIELLLTDLSVVIAHGLSPVDAIMRCVEICSGAACSSVGLAAAGFRHVGSVE